MPFPGATTFSHLEFCSCKAFKAQPALQFACFQHLRNDLVCMAPHMQHRVLLSNTSARFADGRLADIGVIPASSMLHSVNVLTVVFCRPLLHLPWVLQSSSAILLRCPSMAAGDASMCTMSSGDSQTSEWFSSDLLCICHFADRVRP